MNEKKKKKAKEEGPAPGLSKKPKIALEWVGAGEVGAEKCKIESKRPRPIGGGNMK